mgnify:CR=1 FL=1
MDEIPENAPSTDISDQNELIHVLIEDPGEADKCVFFPENARCDELHAKWILALEDSYVHLKDAQ